MGEDRVVVSVVGGCGKGDIQHCLLPYSLLASRSITIGGYVRLELKSACEGSKEGVICRALPSLSSPGQAGYCSVLAWNCVTISEGCSSSPQPVASPTATKTKVYVPSVQDSATTRLSPSRKNEYFPKGAQGTFTISPSAITGVTQVRLSKVEVSVVVKTVEDVVKYRKNRHSFNTSLHALLRLYGIIQGCKINCCKVPIAKMLGVSQVLVVKCSSLCPGEIGLVTEGTEVVAEGVESEDRLQMLVRETQNLGGLDNILAYLRRLVVEPWSRKHEFNEPGVVYPSGVLLVGPPGCGKTSVVRELCAETGACLVATAGAEVLGSYEGETERNFAKVAERARLLSEEGPCIFFIDEIDSLCPVRTKDSSLLKLQLTAQVILTIDECRGLPNLTLMAATNRPYDMDPALRRSGRFEVEILLNVPGAAERVSILQVHTKDLLPPHHPGLTRVAHCTPGFVGADLQGLTSSTQRALQDRHPGQETASPEEVIEVMLSVAGSITPSIHKSLDFITSKPSWGAVGGLAEVKQQLDSIFTHHLKFSQAYDKLKLRRPRGVLLYGPRGCGKTRLVASLAAARGCTFLTANAAHLLSPYVGQSEKNVAALFHAARLAQPTILFLDEIDGIFGSRDKNSGGVQVSLLNELLQALDGADVRATSLQGAALLTSTTATTTQDGVLVCAATNHPERLDPALLRPGRLDHLVLVPLPDSPARLHILQIKTSKMEVESPAMLEQLVERTEGYTGAELEQLVLRAATEAVKQGDLTEETGVVRLREAVLLAALHRSSPSVTHKEMQTYQQFSITLQH